MAIRGAGRLTVAQQTSRLKRHRVGGRIGGRLAIEISGVRGFEARAVEIIKNLPARLAAKGVKVSLFTPLGLELDAASLVGKTAEQIDAMAEKVDELSQVALLRRVKGMEHPEMIDISESVSIMKGEVTVGLFRQVMEGCEITGHKASKLQEILDDPSQTENALTYVSWRDGRKFARLLSEQTGRIFRVQTEDEWLQAVDDWYKTGILLSGKNWTWAEREHNRPAILRHIDKIAHQRNNTKRYKDSAIRLVEDK